jgi:hypothetical protein
MVNLSEMGNITNLTGRDFIKGYQDEIPATFSSTSDVKKKDIVPTIFPASCVTGLGSYTPKGSLKTYDQIVSFGKDTNFIPLESEYSQIKDLTSQPITQRRLKQCIADLQTMQKLENLLIK